MQPDDEVRIIAPSKSLNIISDNNVKVATKRIESLGLKVSFSKNIKQEQVLGCEYPELSLQASQKQLEPQQCRH